MQNLHKNKKFTLLLIISIAFLQEYYVNSLNSQVSSSDTSLLPSIFKNENIRKLPLHEIVLNQDYTTQEKLKFMENVLNNEMQDVDAQDKDGRTALNLITFYKGDSKLAQLLIIKYKANVNKPDRFNVSPLHNALEKEELEIAQMLLDAGADRNLKNDAYENTPIDLARSEKTMALLVS